jgi:uncharacterized protein YcbK (DUF882 family)
MYSIKNDFNLTPNFQLHEVVCKCGKCFSIVDMYTLWRLQALRDKLGKPVMIHSAYRCPEYNEKVDGADHSFHMLGVAFDITCRGVTPLEVARVARKLNFKGIGIYPTFTHVDTRGYKSYWKEIDGKNISISDF